MLTITLAAAVVYVRSRKKTASSSWLMKNCLSICGHRGPLKSSEEHYEENEFEDQLVGLVAISARLAVVAIRFYSLSNDDQMRVCVAELVGVGLSVIHFVLRYGVLIEDQEESPISKLGGSTAIADSTVAVMLLSQKPDAGECFKFFNPTARMLVALVISTVVVTRCVFSAACCGVLWPPFHRQGRKYAYVLMFFRRVVCNVPYLRSLLVTLCLSCCLLDVQRNSCKRRCRFFDSPVYFLSVTASDSLGW